MGFTKIESQNIEDAFVEAGHNFKVNTAQVQYDVAGTDPFNQNILIDDQHKVVFRSDTGQALGCMSKKYTHSQPNQIWDMAEELSRISGGKISKSLTIDNGRVIGVELELEKREYILNDPVLNGFMLMDSFDGSITFSARLRSVRLVCTNGMTAKGTHDMYSIRHSGIMNKRIDEAMNMLSFYKSNMEIFNQNMDKIAKTEMSHKEAVDWFKSLYPEPKEGRSQTMMDNKVSKFEYLLENGHGTDIKGVKGTAYGALNAFTEMINHHGTVRVASGRLEDDVRAESLLLGSANNQMSKAFKSLVAA
jgi:phage/plasmid-like protein (TIGR03299 family)